MQGVFIITFMMNATMVLFEPYRFSSLEARQFKLMMQRFVFLCITATPCCDIMIKDLINRNDYTISGKFPKSL